MHTAITPSGRRYHFNSDFSGPVHIVLAGDEFETEGGACAHALIPVEDLRAIVAAADQAAETTAPKLTGGVE
jgi:hypothetical protein